MHVVRVPNQLNLSPSLLSFLPWVLLHGLVQEQSRKHDREPELSGPFPDTQLKKAHQ